MTKSQRLALVTLWLVLVFEPAALCSESAAPPDQPEAILGPYGATAPQVWNAPAPTNTQLASGQRAANTDLKDSQLLGFVTGYSRGYGRGWIGMKTIRFKCRGARHRKQAELDCASKFSDELRDWYNIDLRETASSFQSMQTESTIPEQSKRYTAYVTGFKDAYFDASMAGFDGFLDLPGPNSSTPLSVDDAKLQMYRSVATAVYNYADKIGSPYTIASGYLANIKAGILSEQKQ